MTLGRSKENKDWQVLTILISLVLKSLIKKPFITKSREFRSFLVNRETGRRAELLGYVDTDHRHTLMCR